MLKTAKPPQSRLVINPIMYPLIVLGESAAIAACAQMVRESGMFHVDPLPDDHFEIGISDLAKRDRVLAHMNANPIPGSLAFELHIKTDARWKLIASDAADAVAIMQAVIEECEGEIEPMEEEFLPKSEWNPTRVDYAWIP